MTEVYQQKMGRLQPRIDAADRFCSILFPLAFTLVMVWPTPWPCWARCR